MTLSVLGPAQPASAHTLGPSGSSDYRSALTGVYPSVVGVVVQVLDDGQHVELSNATPTPLVVLGYSGEPYLMVSKTGVWENVRSPYLKSVRVSMVGSGSLLGDLLGRWRSLGAWERAAEFCNGSVGVGGAVKAGPLGPPGGGALRAPCFSCRQPPWILTASRRS
jgi:hypothetical protein